MKISLERRRSIYHGGGGTGVQEVTNRSLTNSYRQTLQLETYDTLVSEWVSAWGLTTYLAIFQLYDYGVSLVQDGIPTLFYLVLHNRDALPEC